MYLFVATREIAVPIPNKNRPNQMAEKFNKFVIEIPNTAMTTLISNALCLLYLMLKPPSKAPGTIPKG